ncbi:hypothetical protein LTR60_006106, partial [Cryomyces antarcticus]
EVELSVLEVLLLDAVTGLLGVELDELLSADVVSEELELGVSVEVWVDEVVEEPLVLKGTVGPGKLLEVVPFP